MTKSSRLQLHTKVFYCRLLCLFVIGSLFTASPKNALAATASFALSPTTKTAAIGETFTVDVVANTGGSEVSGADMYITFDSNKLTLLDIQNGTIFEQYVGKEINNATGKASISGLVGFESTLFSGSGTYATLQFKAIDSGAAAVNFDFTAGNSRDTNLVDFNSGLDILTSVTNGTYTISGVANQTSSSGNTSTTTTTTTTSNNNSTSTTQQTQQQTSKGGLPVSATPTPTIVVGIAGLVFIWISLLFHRIFG
ncbi:hypothetical protein HY468_03695 [Candidatus Roizmanbacteria bacterium]|nr:hypothetical protein [Candidatus Roizmanbacteria bacterium]